MNEQAILNEQTPPIDPALLSFGIGVFQAAMAGELQTSVEVGPGDELAHMGIHAIQHEIEGHGLSEREEISLMFRVLAFPRLLEDAAGDTRTHSHVQEMGHGYVVSEEFLRAASRCDLRAESSGAFRYDIDSLIRQLTH